MSAPPAFPQYMQPVIGYAYWLLSRGETPENVAVRMASRAWGEEITANQRRVALETAQHYLEYSRRATSLVGVPGNVPIYLADPVAGQTTGTVGIRVLVAATMVGGAVKEVSVLVNASLESNVTDIALQAMEWVRLHGQEVWGDRYPIESVDFVSFSQLSPIPWDNPALTA